MPTIAFDNETFLIERTQPAPRLVCSSFADGSSVLLLKHGPRLWAWFRQLLENPDVNFVGQNVAYDFATLTASRPELLPLIFDAYKAGRVTDTQIRQQLFDIVYGRQWDEDKLPSYTLAMLCDQVLDINIKATKEGPNIWRLRYSELYDVPLEDWPADAVKYAKDDAIYTYQVWDKQREKVGHLLRDDAAHTYNMFCLALTQMRGMICDPVAVERLRAEQTAKMIEFRPRLLKAKLLYYDKKKDHYVKKQNPAKERIIKACNAKGIEPFLTKKGTENKKEGKPYDDLKYISTDRASCYWADDDLMVDRANYTTAEKLLTTYYPFLKEGTYGPITTRFNLASTGRTTSSAPREPLVGGNFQNMPRDPGPRECIIPRPGYVFLAGDFAGAELHALAQVCKWKLGHSTLGDVLNAGQDVHLFLASHLLKISYEEALKRYEAGDKDVKEARQQAKPANFGFAGYMFEKRFIKEQLKYGVRWEFDDVRRLRESWLEAFPEMNDYFEINRKELGPKGVTTIELYMSKRLRKIRGLPMMCNTWFQSLVADGVQVAIDEVIRRCFVERYSKLYVCRPVNFVHDELILEIPDRPELWPMLITEFKAVMITEFNKFVPDYPTTVDAVLMRRWSKNAEPVFDAGGNMIPWDWSE